MRRLLPWVLAASLVVTVLPAAAKGPPQGPVYMALGDSHAFGVGVHPEEKLGFVPVLHRWLRSIDCRGGFPAGCPHLELANLSIPGATTSSLIANQLGPALALIADRNGDTDSGNDVVLITLTIGGNDLFNPVVAACTGGPTSQCAQVIATVFATAGANLAVILGTLRAAAPEAQIVISTYDNPLAACFLSALAPLADVVLEGGMVGGASLPLGFNDIIRNVAGALGVDVADTFGQLDVDDWVGGQDCLHPDNSGYHMMADIFRGEIDDLT